MAGSRPEYTGPPEQYYDETEARKYSTNTRIQKVQTELAERAYELLELPTTDHDQASPSLLLDIGCGSGLSGEVLAANGHHWVGVDISRPMLDVAREDNDAGADGQSGGHLLLADMGAGLPFRAASFDGAISISAVQWLCHSNARAEYPHRRLSQFFTSLHACLCRTARAVFQFYPDSAAQSELITQQALRAGFQGGLVVDHPESAKNRKVFLVLSAGKAGAIGPNRSGIRSLTVDDESEGRIRNVGRSRTWKGKQKGKLQRKRRLETMKGQRVEKRRQRRAKKKRNRAKNGENRDGEDVMETDQ